MKTSETIIAISKALGAFRRSAKNLSSDGLGAGLRRNKLLVIQDTRGDGRTVGAMTRIVHETSGEWIETEWLMLPTGRSANDGIASLEIARWSSLLASLGVARADVLEPADHSDRPAVSTPAEPVSPAAKAPFKMPAWKVKKIEGLARATKQSQAGMCALLKTYGGATEITAMTREDSDRLITHLENLKEKS